MSCAIRRILPSGWAVLLVSWAILLACAMYAVERYRMTPAIAGGGVPTTWPSQVQLLRNPGRLTLVMALHPRCPCSRASLDELEILLARAGADRIDARVIVVEPDDAPAGWSRGELWDRAAGIPGVTVCADPGARDSATFGAAVSGDLRVYAADGRLLFSGGITDGRGHDGDNAGLDAVLQLARGERPAIDHTPVYGCRLTSTFVREVQ